MIPVYEAAGPIDAHLLRGLLEQAGIDARVIGEDLLGGVGDLPAQGLVRVLVDLDDWDAARAIVERFEADLRA